MAQGNGGISHQMHTSLCDLSEELKSLGIKSVIKNESTATELCEALLSTTWLLINLVHSNAMGLNESCRNPCDRELLLRAENQSLEVKLENLRSEVNMKEKMISKEKQNVLIMEMELKKNNQACLKQKQMITQLTAQLEKQEKDFKLNIAKQEVQNENLREMVRKSVGVGLRSRPISVEKMGDSLGSLTIACKELSDLEESTLNRLKSTNQILIGENLMLRDALKLIHSDINNVLTSKQTKVEDSGASILQESIFALPLSYSMKKIKDMRFEQICQLRNKMQMYDDQ